MWIRSSGLSRTTRDRTRWRSPSARSVRGLSARRAAAVLKSDVEAFERLGYRPHEGDSPYSVLLASPEGRRDLALRLRPEGRVFEGNWGLELSTAEPVLPPTSRGLT